MIGRRHGDDTSDTFEEGNARQDGTGPVQGPRAAARHAGQPPRLRARENAEHPQRHAVGPEVAVGGFSRAGDTGRTRDAVPLPGRRRLLLYGYLVVRADPYRSEERRVGKGCRSRRATKSEKT